METEVAPDPIGSIEFRSGPFGWRLASQPIHLADRVGCPLSGRWIAIGVIARNGISVTNSSHLRDEPDNPEPI